MRFGDGPGPWGCAVFGAVCFRSWGVLVLNRVLQRPHEGRIYGLAGRMRFAASLSVSVYEWPGKTIKRRPETEGCRSGAGTPRPRAVHSGGRGGVGAWCCCCFCSFRFSSAFASGSSRAVSFVWSFASCLSRLLRCVFSCPLSGAWCSPSHRRVGEGFLSLSLLLLFCAPRVLSIRVWARARPKQSAVRVFGEGPRAC